MKFLKSLKPPGRTPDVIVKQVRFLLFHDKRCANAIYALVFASNSPFSIMRSIDFTGWMLLLSGWLAWTMDGYDVSCHPGQGGGWIDPCRWLLMRLRLNGMSSTSVSV